MEQKLIKLEFPLGIPGFETYREWNLILEEDVPLAQLIAANNEYIGFVITNPELYFPAYLNEIKLNADGQKVLKVQENTKFEVWNILCMSSNVMETTINLKAPLILNLEKQLGYQLILDDEKHNSQELLFNQQDGEIPEKGVTD